MSEYNYNYNYNQNNNNGDPNRNRKQNDDWLSWTLIIIMFALGVWPVALPLLFIKLFLPDRKERKNFIPSLWASASSTIKNTTEEVKRAVNTNESSAEPAKQANRARDAAQKVVRSPSLKSSTSWLLRLAGILVAALGVFGLMGPVSSALANAPVGEYLRELLQYLSIAVAGGGTFFAGLKMSLSMKKYSKYLAVVGNSEAMSISSIARKLGHSERRTVKDLQKMIEKGYFGQTAYLNMELGYLFRSGDADAELTANRDAAMRRTQAARAQATNDSYSDILAGIRKANDRIADPALTEKINRLESITENIFRAVEADPKKRERIDTFLNYYLPTTQKLLNAYAEFERTGVEGENLREAKSRIQSTMDSIVSGFEHQLDELYKTDAMDVDSDISVMETMLRRDTASASKDFGFGGEQRPASSGGKDVDLGGMAGQKK